MTISVLEGLREHRMPALARAISLVENGRDGYEELLSALHHQVGRAHRVGITGPPGAGKSTLVEGLVKVYRAQGKTVAVIAVDPTSPFSGGALLGDRIRMESLTLDPGVYIRSMATRGAVGGLAMTTREVCDVADAFGFDRIIVETVGVGQSELEIAAASDTAILVLVPESGDGVQVLKAGVMEIADIYVVNKADRPGADKLRQEIEVMLGIRQGNAFRHVRAHHGVQDGETASKTQTVRRPDGETVGEAQTASAGSSSASAESLTVQPSNRPTVWTPPVLTTVALKWEGAGAVVEAIEAHAGYLQESGELNRRRRARLERHTREVVDRSLRQRIWQEGAGEARLANGLDRVARGEASPYELAREIVAELNEGIHHE